MIRSVCCPCVLIWVQIFNRHKIIKIIRNLLVKQERSVMPFQQKDLTGENIIKIMSYTCSVDTFCTTYKNILTL